jgi:hypothetical protein
MSFQTNSLTPELPWSTNPQEERQFRRILALLLILLLSAMIIIPLVKIPELKREQTEQVPQQVARFIVEHQTISPPKQPSPPLPAKPNDLNQKKAQTKASTKKQGKARKLEQPNAREVAQKHISYFSSSLAEISALPVVPQTLKVVTATESQNTSDIYSGSLNTGTMSTRIHAGSGSLTIAKASEIGAPQALSNAPLQRASKTLGPSKQGAETTNSTTAKKAERNKRIVRSRENIQKVFDTNKGAIYAIYNRALRSNPDLEGKVIFKLVISPEGKVIQCEIGSSDLRAPRLEQKLMARIKLFNFGAIKNVEVWRDSFYLDFIPAP